MKIPRNLLVLAAVLLAGNFSARAELKLAAVFGDNMVLQQQMAVPVWGWTTPGANVTVKFSGQIKTVRAAADGKWLVKLGKLKASFTPQTLTVEAGEIKILTNILVGEVWLASGQSNMDFTMSKKVKRFAGVMNEETEIAAANYPLIRMFTGDAQKTFAPTNRIGGEWKICTPENAPAFSAVAYFFARDLQREIKIPVGIITEAFGASTAEAWIDRETLASDAKLKPLLDRFDAAAEKFRTNPPPVVAAARSEDVSATNAAPRGRSRAVRDPVQDQYNATVMFNGMIAPVIPFAIRGAIWYQGESIVDANKGGIELYPRVQAALIRDWRKLWSEGDFPFYIVQLAGQEAASNSPLVREAQATVRSLKNTDMAVATDIGEAKNVHPKNKQDVGDRLARIALAKTYGRKIECSGPFFESIKVDGNSIRVKFSHADGLMARDGNLKWFTIAGAAGKFVSAAAKIDGNTVVVSSPEISAPVAVRYAWANFPDGGHLYNSAGLPAVQFRSDAPK